MRYKLFLLFFFAFFTTLISFSQGKKYIYYFDENFKSIDKTKSVYTGTGSTDNGLFKLIISFNRTMQVVSIDHYTDSTLKVYQGLSQTYFSTGAKESEGNYENNNEHGVWKKWDITGHLIDSSLYENGKLFQQNKFAYNKDKLIITSFKDVQNNKEEIITYNDSGKISSSASFTGQKGILKYYEKEGERTDTVYSKEEIEASFKGGEEAWNKYIFREINSNINALTADGASGTCKVRFIINVDGKISDVKAITMQGTALAEVAVNALKNGPKWNPAMQYGRPVKAYREQPITFNIVNR